MSAAVTLDIGGSHVTAALVRLTDRRLLRTARRDVDHTAPADRLLLAWSDAALEALGPRQDRPAHLGIAVPSPFDPARGVSRMEHKFRALLGRPLRPDLEVNFAGTVLAGVPVRFGNDADLFALGEWWAGAGRGSDRMIGLTLGTGLGSGFVSGGRVVTSGEGVPPDGELWNVPFREDRAETYASGAALTRAWVARSGASLGAAELAALARSGDAVALEVWSAFGATLADLLSPWAGRFRADRLLLGGNVSRSADLFVPALQAGLPGCRVVVSEHFEAAALLGAAAL